MWERRIPPMLPHLKIEVKVALEISWPIWRLGLNRVFCMVVGLLFLLFNTIDSFVISSDIVQKFNFVHGVSDQLYPCGNAVECMVKMLHLTCFEYPDKSIRRIPFFLNKNETQYF